MGNKGFGLAIVLVAPQIPQNTGNIARMCAATFTELHLVKPLGFSLEDSSLKRAGLDYWSEVKLFLWEGWDDFVTKNPNKKLFFFETGNYPSYFTASFSPHDVFVFGRETKGLSKRILSLYPQSIFSIPILNGAVRSLNLANCVSIVLYEALRQIYTKNSK
ncbi:tRNA (cytidine(34)-2'-O)-methyltransferase [Methylacidiphilum caldifontis]|uniref:tRNA (cytidine(34)-2'-O)-methyltransferase n=1 Tax=Methylacidiphilum caldifontis TaxID=2795386 RepID=UPI001A8D6990|nr:tRNA (cytidine(34)-2'-O)-methyltransferase [Methylacidiphilum caldifontis]QSR87910.1 tRNA (cytidine(34)-2'-O)-methyltransferase [Methylacidiphilum caldifontis]